MSILAHYLFGIESILNIAVLHTTSFKVHTHTSYRSPSVSQVQGFTSSKASQPPLIFVSVHTFLNVHALCSPLPYSRCAKIHLHRAPGHCCRSGLCQLAGLAPLEDDGDDDGDDDDGDEDDDCAWEFIKDSSPPAAVPCNTCYPLMTDTRLYPMSFLPSTVSDEYKLIKNVTAQELVISLQVLKM